MIALSSQSGAKVKPFLPARRLYAILATRAYSIIMFGALFCTLTVKFFHAWRIDLLDEYFSWIFDDIAILLGIEAILALLCFRLAYKWLIRAAYICAAVVCTWSVMNAGWLIRTGTQILPAVLLPLFRDPINALCMIGVNLAKSPTAAVILLVPSAIALAFFLSVLAKPLPPNYNRKRFAARIAVSVLLVLVAVFARDGTLTDRGSPQIVSEGMRYNCQLRAVTSLLFPGSTRLTKTNFADAKRKIPAFDDIQIAISPKHRRLNHNIVLVVLEGVQYRYTSLYKGRLRYDEQVDLTPYLTALAQQGVEFTNVRSSLTHTTKVLFSLLTGRFPSVSQDIAETVPIEKPYAGLPTILKQKLNFRTAFFQSAKGNFESRPGLVHNLGFDKFWARDDSNDTDAFLGYLACDEFAMLQPIVDWIKADSSDVAEAKTDDRPFFLTVLLSVTHDPYEVPKWFAEPAKEPLARYRQTVAYTDKFLAALDVELAKLNLTDKTILCVIGDHGEAFGEHGLLGHERIPFDENLLIPFCLRAPFLIQQKTTVTRPVSSVDLAPTLLALLGFDVQAADFDGINALGTIPDGRKVYFSGWLSQSPAGFVKENRKFIYYPANKLVSVYDLSADPLELSPTELTGQQGHEIADDIIAWRQDTLFLLDQKRIGKKTLFDTWLCRWNNRVSSVKHRPSLSRAKPALP